MLSKELNSLVAEAGPYYSVKNLPLHELITHEFINTFVKKGKQNRVVSWTWQRERVSRHRTRALVSHRARGDVRAVKGVCPSPSLLLTLWLRGGF